MKFHSTTRPGNGGYGILEFDERPAEWPAAHYVLCGQREDGREDGRRRKRPIAEGWQKPGNAASAAEAQAHHVNGGLVGVMPGSLGCCVFDLDGGEAPAAIQEAGAWMAPSRAGRHYWLPWSFLGKKPLAWGAGGKGDLIGSTGFVILWNAPGATLAWAARNGGRKPPPEWAQLVHDLAAGKAGGRNIQLNGAVFSAAAAGNAKAAHAAVDAALAAGLPAKEVAATTASAAAAGAAKTAGKQAEEEAGAAFAEHVRGRLAWDRAARGWREYDPESGLWGAPMPAGDAAILERIRVAVPGLRRANTYAGALKMAQSHIHRRDWDKEPGGLAVPGGWLELATGKMLPAEAGRFATRSLAAAPAEAPCEDLDKVVRGLLARCPRPQAEDCYRFVQAWCYAALTGRAHEYEVLLFIQGAPGGGKSTFAEGIRAAFGGYAAVIGGNRLAHEAKGQHAQWMGRFDGPRLVVCAEVGGGAWQSGVIQNAVSGEEIEYNPMHQNSRTFTPRCGVMVAGNERPVAPPGAGIWRRLALVEAPRIERARRDPGIKARIMANPGGALRWVLDGRRAFEAGALKRVPQHFAAATANYRVESGSHLDAWINERTIQGGRALSHLLYNDYCGYCADAGEYGSKLSAAKFGRELSKRGHLRSEARETGPDGKRSRFRLGLSLRP